MSVNHLADARAHLFMPLLYLLSLAGDKKNDAFKIQMDAVTSTICSVIKQHCEQQICDETWGEHVSYESCSVKSNGATGANR